LYHFHDAVNYLSKVTVFFTPFVFDAPNGDDSLSQN